MLFSSLSDSVFKGLFYLTKKLHQGMASNFQMTCVRMILFFGKRNRNTQMFRFPGRCFPIRLPLTLTSIKFIAKPYRDSNGIKDVMLLPYSQVLIPPNKTCKFINELNYS